MISCTSPFDQFRSIYKLEVNFTSHIKEYEKCESDVIERKVSYIRKNLGNDRTL